MGEINFIFTPDQQEVVCKHFNLNAKELEDWQIAELLDKLIDENVE